jgi:hypothetical protein
MQLAKMVVKASHLQPYASRFREVATFSLLQKTMVCIAEPATSPAIAGGHMD